MLGGRHQEDLVARLDDGIALRRHRLIAAEDCRNAGIHLQRQQLAQVPDRPADQRAALEGAHADEADTPGSEGENLQRFGEFDQAPDVLGNHLFRAKREVHGEVRG